VPFNDLATTLKRIEVDYMITCFVAGKSPNEICRYLLDLEEIFNGRNIFVAGLLCEQLEFNGFKKCTRIKNFAELCQHIQ
jgi:hypothetical protein